VKRSQPFGASVLSRGPLPRRRRRWASLFGLGSARRAGPSPAECLIPQMQEQVRRKHYHDRDVSSQAPNKLIGYVSAGSLKKPGMEPRPHQGPQGRAVVVALAIVLVLIWLGFGGI
jgi:hypothetical protein